MSKSSREKGNRAERELVHILEKNCIQARRVPLSGAMKDTGFGGDLLVRGSLTLMFTERDEERWEVKSRGNADGFKMLYKWLEDARVLALKADRKEWLVVTRLEDL